MSLVQSRLTSSYLIICKKVKLIVVNSNTLLFDHALKFKIMSPIRSKLGKNYSSYKTKLMDNNNYITLIWEVMAVPINLLSFFLLAVNTGESLLPVLEM